MIGKVIKSFRTVNILTLDKLSKSSGVSKIYITELERGIKKQPSTEILNKFANTFNVSLDFLENLIDYSYTVENILNQGNKLDEEQKNKLLFQIISYKILEYYTKQNIEKGIFNENILNYKKR